MNQDENPYLKQSLIELKLQNLNDYLELVKFNLPISQHIYYKMKIIMIFSVISMNNNYRRSNTATGAEGRKADENMKALFQFKRNFIYKGFRI